jgi:hypothetical protein
MNTAATIPPEKVARKLAEVFSIGAPDIIKQLESEPRLVELMWYIQWHSMQPQGLQKLTDGLLAAFQGRFITAAMQKAGVPRKGRYSVEECANVWSDWPVRAHTFWWEEKSESLDVDSKITAEPDLEHFATWASFHFHLDRLDARTELRESIRGKSALAKGCDKFNWQFLNQECVHTARRELPEHLKQLCIDYGTGFSGVWYCPSLIETLFDFMDRHAGEAMQRIAMTEVSRKVIDAFDFAWDQRSFVRLDGDSRFGKSESVKAYCAGRPGRFRMVTVPSSNAETDLIRAVGLAFGSESPLGGSGQGLRAKVEFILRHGGIGLAFDESHYLWPTRYSSSTSPGRINWVRAEVVDRGLPCILITTPQSYKVQMAKFLKSTGYNVDQFEGRISLHVSLPTTLGPEDCLRVARLRCPEFGDVALKLVVGAALHSASYLKGVEDIGNRARWLAKQRGASADCISDVKAAIADVVPSCAALVSGQTPHAADPVQLEGKTKAARPRVRRKPAAEVVRDLRPGRADENFSPESGASEQRMMANRVPALATV